MSTIFLTALNTHDNIANIVMKSSWEAAKTLQLNSHETSLSKVKTAGSQYLCGFPFSVLAKCLQFFMAVRILNDEINYW